MSYICPKCSKGYKAKSSLKTHTDKFILAIKYSCTECGSPFSSKSSRDIHVKERHRGKKRRSKRIPCPECGQEFQDKDKMENHRDAKHDLGREYPCVDCGLIFDTKPKLAYHKKREHEKSSNVCVCGIHFASKQNLRNHCDRKDNECRLPEVMQPDVRMVTNESAMMAQKENYESGNVAKKFLYQVSEQMKNFITETTPLNMDGIPCCFHNE